MNASFLRASCLALVACAPAASQHAAARPSGVDVTWFSISNVQMQVGALGIVADGYVTRLPNDAFSGGQSGVATTNRPLRPDTALVARVRAALGGSVDVLLTGHSHFDHAFDTGAWARLTGARVIGSPTTCYQVEAQGIPASRCTPVLGGERIALSSAVTVWIVRWNHSGSATTNPELHEPIELHAPPRPDPATGGLRAGVREDFPNGGGGRGYLFVADTPDGRLSWFYQNSASPTDLAAPVIVEGTRYPAPLESLRAAMRAANVASVDLWIGTASQPVAELVVPVLRPRAFLPVHFDDLAKPIGDGLPTPFANPALETYLAGAGVTLVRPTQFLDRWRLDATGVHALDGSAARRALGIRTP